jgi:hypothetical protein
MDYGAVEKLQHTFCINRNSDYVPAALESKLALAIGTLGKVPVNGLRHPPERGTNGWYIWCGEELSDVPDFFAPLHTAHLSEYCPEKLNIWYCSRASDSSRPETIWTSGTTPLFRMTHNRPDHTHEAATFMV